MVYALGLPDALKRRGLVVEVLPGWETRSAGSFAPRGAVCHWTAGPAGTLKRPSLSICTYGRPDLPGPLCNVYLDRRGVAVVVAAGRANHAGAGSWRGATGNSSFFGTECESAGPNDFTAEQRAAYPRVNAAFCDLGGFGPEMVCGHSEYATPRGRKQDINGYTMDDMRADVASVLAGQLPTSPLQEDDMYDVNDRKRDTEILRLLGNLNGYQNSANQNENEARLVPTVAGEAQRMLGVLLGWQAPASQNEAEALAKLWNTTPANVTVTIDPATIAAAIPASIAADVVELLSQRLASA